MDGGRYLVEVAEVVPASYVIRAWSPTTGQLLSTAAFGLEGTNGPPQIVGDSNRPRVFLWNGQTISSVTLAGVAPIATGGVAPKVNNTSVSNRLMAFAPIAEVLFVGGTPRCAALTSMWMSGTDRPWLPRPSIVAPRSRSAARSCRPSTWPAEASSPHSPRPIRARAAAR